MTFPRRWIFAGAGAFVAAAAGVFLLLGGGDDDEVSLPPGLEREELEIVIRDYILEHPEIIPEAMQRLEERRMTEMVSAVRGELEQPFGGAWIGAADPDVTIVEFFDYACGYCRASLPDVQRLVEEDDGVRVVFRELPILSPESETAARVSLVAAQQGEYFDFHRAMFDAGRPGEATIAQARSAAGLDAARVSGAVDDAEITAELTSNLELARRLQLTGTPAFVIGDRILSGAVGYERLKEAVEEAREANRT